MISLGERASSRSCQFCMRNGCITGRRRRSVRRIAAVKCVLVASLSIGLVQPVTVQSATGDVHPLVAFQAKEARLFEAGYRLAVANAEFCDTAKPTLGLLIHDAGAYADAARVRSVFRLSGDIGVQAVADGSPADLAGLRQNDTLIAVDNQPIAAAELPAARGWERAAGLQTLIDETSADGEVMLTWRTGNGVETTAALVPVSACASAFELISGNNEASSDGVRVLIGEGFPGFAYSDKEFSAAIAHELAHNLLQHIAYFKSHRRKHSRIRLAERDADRMMPWLLFNAGFEAEAAIRFMEKWGPRHDGWIFRGRTHDGWDERVEFIETELVSIAAASAERSDGKADWSRHFNQLLRANTVSYLSSAQTSGSTEKLSPAAAAQ